MFPSESLSVSGNTSVDVDIINGSANGVSVLSAYMMTEATTTTASADLKCGTRPFLKLTNRMSTNLPAIRTANFLGVEECIGADINIDVTNQNNSGVTYQVTYIELPYASTTQLKQNMMFSGDLFLGIAILIFIATWFLMGAWINSLFKRSYDK